MLDDDAPILTRRRSKKIGRAAGQALHSKKTKETFIGETIDYSGNYQIVRFYLSDLYDSNWIFEVMDFLNLSDLFI